MGEMLRAMPRRRMLAVVGLAGALAVVVSLGIASPAEADGFPTWPEVQAAKANAAAAQKELAKINAAVAQLQAEQDAAAAQEAAAANAAAAAASALQTAETKLSSLKAALAAARKKAAAARARFAATEVQLSRQGGPGDLTAQLLASTRRGDDLLGRLGSLDRLGQRSAQLEAAARQAQNQVGSLRAAADAAEKAQATLKAGADAKLQAAQAAQSAAEAKLASGRQQSAVLAQQAQALGGTAAALTASWNSRPAASTPAATGGSPGGGGSTDTSGVIDDPAAAKAYAQGAIAGYGWGSDQFSCLVSLWNMESGWRTSATNPSSGAYGIPQAWPGNKMLTAGPDWRTNAHTQINWGLGYIKAAYGSPCGAWNFEMSHTPHWY
jgi:predicted  nucleic acid-binding Zn-ribbon protein